MFSCTGNLPLLAILYKCTGSLCTHEHFIGGLYDFECVNTHVHMQHSESYWNRYNSLLLLSY